MKILIAPDSFKGSLSAAQASQIIKDALLRHLPHADIRTLPLADGGEGSIDVLAHSLPLSKHLLQVQGPLGRNVLSYYYMDEKAQTAYIEMAKASGITLVSRGQLDPMAATTLGTGELVADALKCGARKIVLFIGGSATNDAGTGMAHALGYRFLDYKGDGLHPNGKNLGRIRGISTELVNPLINKTEFVVATDVNNPFYGPEGAAAVYGPQKGADNGQVEALDAGLKSLAIIIQQSLGLDLQSIPGSGAAGGLGGGAVAFLDAHLESGAPLIFDIAGFDNALREADLVISGEGKTDKQSLYEKLLAHVARRAKNHDVPLWLICGFLEGRPEDFQSLGIEQIFRLAENPADIQQAINHAAQYLTAQAERAAQRIKESWKP